MSLFVFFILAAVLLGAGAMLSPAWRSTQPRVALAATLCLGLVVGGAVFYAEAFGWDTLVVDYLLFALLSGVVLGGTLSTAQARAEARGERLADRDQGWPGPGDLTFFAFVALLLLIPLVQLAAPPGEQAPIIGFHSLALREGGSFASLAPYLPDERVIVSPGFHALSAYLSAQLEQSIPLIQLSVTAVVALLLVWLAYDLGAELVDKGLGRAMSGAALLCLGLYRSYLDGHFAELLALPLHVRLPALRAAIDAQIQYRRSRRGRPDDGGCRLLQLEPDDHHLARLDSTAGNHVDGSARKFHCGFTLGVNHRLTRCRSARHRPLAGK